MSLMNEKEFNKRFDAKLWVQMSKYALKHWKYLLIIFIMMAILAFTETRFALLTREAIDNFIIPKQSEGVVWYTLKYFAVAATNALCIYVFIIMGGRAETLIGYDLREKGFKKLQELSFSYYDKTPIGWMMSRMTSDIRRFFEIFTWGFLDLSWAISMMVIMTVTMLRLNVTVGLMVLAVLPIMAVVGIVVQRKMLAAHRDVRKENSLITADFAESINGVKTIKTLVREKENEKEFYVKTNKMKSYAVKAAILSAFFMPVIVFLGSVGTGLAIWGSSVRVFGEVITVGTFAAFIQYTQLFFFPIIDISRYMAEMQRAQAAGERVLSLLNSKPDIEDSEEVIEKYGDVFNPKKENWEEMNGDIEFKDVNFFYKEGEQILKDFNLKIKKGETIALVGETGSGKSTLINLICRFYQPQSGEILIDGIDYRKRSQLWLQSNLGYVLQTPHLFSGTIKDNILYGRMDASDEEVAISAQAVHADDFIKKFDKGYDTEVGEGGAMLSTGQKQLISFARAILADPKLLILDEATSSVDTEIEALIQNAINRLLEGRTSFVIAHRLSTIRKADKILVIKNGDVFESGTHEELLHNRGYYYSLYTNQFIGNQEEKILNHME